MKNTTATTMESTRALSRDIQLIRWHDVLVIVDTGRAAPEEYAQVVQFSEPQRARYREGFGIVSVIPRDATPPPDYVRKAINEAYDSLKADLRCVSWVVEGSGFQGAMVRAVLTGLRFISATPYPTDVYGSMEEAMAWVLTKLAPRKEREPIRDGVLAIQHQRLACTSVPPISGVR